MPLPAPWGPAFDAGRFIRVVNFHATPAARAASYERQLTPYAEAFSSVTVADLDGLFATGEWPKERPGLIPVLYEGHRDNVEVALPILERLGMVGWFFLPTAFPDVAVPDQQAFAEAHRIRLVPGEQADGRWAMTWDDVASIDARGHVVAAHTATHARIDAIRTADDVEREIVGPSRVLERVLGRRPEVFAWLHGFAYGDHPLADAALLATGYRYVFSNTRIQRIA